MVDNKVLDENKKRYLLNPTEYKITKVKKSPPKKIGGLKYFASIYYLEYYANGYEYIVVSKSNSLIYNFLLNLEVSAKIDENNKLELNFTHNEKAQIINKQIVLDKEVYDYSEQFDLSEIGPEIDNNYLKIKVSFKVEDDSEVYFVQKNIRYTRSTNFKINNKYSIKSRKGNLFVFKTPKNNLLKGIDLATTSCALLTLRENYKMNEEIAEQDGLIYYRTTEYIYIIKNKILLVKYLSGLNIRKDIQKIIKKLEEDTNKGLEYKIKNLALRAMFKTLGYERSLKLNIFVKNMLSRTPYRFYVNNMDKLSIKKDTILLEGFNGNEFNGNMYALLKEYAKQDKELFISIKDDSKIKPIIEKDNIKVEYIKSYTKKYYEKLITSEYIITDTTLPRFYIPTKGQIVVNTWHGTPLKSMGRHIESSPFALSNSQRNFFLTNVLTLSNQFTIDVMKESYMLDNKEIKLLPSPRNSIFFEETKPNKQKTVLWMPTWRESEENDIGVNLKLFKRIQKIVLEVLEKDENIKIYVKPHQMIKDLTENMQGLEEIPEDIEVYTFLKDVDVLITDYSSIMFDFANKNKKIILDIEDLEEYKKTRGLILDIESLPFTLANNGKQIVDEIIKNEEVDYSDFNKIYNPLDNKNGTKEVIKAIENYKLNSNAKSTNVSKKEKVLIFPSNMNTNGITTSFLNLLSNLKGANYDFTIFLPIQSIKKEDMKNVLQIGSDIKYIAAPAGIIIKNEERYVYHKFINRIKITEEENKIINNIYKREVKRLFANLEYDHLIHFSGYDVYPAKLFLNMPGKKHIFVHNDMKEELELKNNVNEQVIWEYYEKADTVNVVNEQVLEKLKFDYFKDSENIKNKLNVVHNTINVLDIIERSKLKEDYMTDEFLSVLEDLECTKFINIGRFSPEKGQERLIEAFNNISSTNKNRKFVLFLIGGNGIDKDKIVNLINISEFKDNIYLFENINPLPILKHSDLFVLSSYHEGLPMVFFESLILDVPILSTDIPGTSSFLNKGYGNICENSTGGLIKGLQDYVDLKLDLSIKNLESFNKEALEQFLKILE